MKEKTPIKVPAKKKVINRAYEFASMCLNHKVHLRFRNPHENMGSRNPYPPKNNSYDKVFIVSSIASNDKETKVCLRSASSNDAGAKDVNINDLWPVFTSDLIELEYCLDENKDVLFSRVFGNRYKAIIRSETGAKTEIPNIYSIEVTANSTALKRNGYSSLETVAVIPTSQAVFLEEQY